jgi:hypothetical protein
MAAILILGVNDHVLKGSGILPGVLTGKISDFAGLFFFPLLLAGVFRLFWSNRPVRAHGLATVLTALTFAGLKLDPWLNVIAARAGASFVMDATDLCALPMVGLSYLWMTRRPSIRWPRLQLPMAFLAAVATAATSRPPSLIAWEAQQHQAGDPPPCFALEPSVMGPGPGQETFVADLRLKGLEICDVTLESARLLLPTETREGTFDKQNLRLGPDEYAPVVVSFPSSPKDLKDQVFSKGKIEVELSVGGVPHRWSGSLSNWQP